MARYNKIFAGPFTEATPQVTEALLNTGTAKPGTMLVLTAGKFVLAGVAATGAIFVAQENYLLSKGVDDDYGTNTVVIGMRMLDEQFFNARVASGVNIAKGAPLALKANGLLGVPAAADRVVAYAEETYNNNTGDPQLVRVRAIAGYLVAPAP